MAKPSLQEIQIRLLTLLRCLNPNYPGAISLETTLRNDLGYDEIGLRALSARVNRDFGFTFDPDQMPAIISVEGLAFQIDYYWPNQE